MLNVMCEYMPGSEQCADNDVVSGITVLPPALEAYMDAQAGDPLSPVNQGIAPLWRNPFTSHSRLLTPRVTEDIVKVWQHAHAELPCVSTLVSYCAPRPPM